ncbi:unnamed protein product [Closterium sp. NIES-53]
MEAEGSAPAGPSGSGGVRGTGEAGRGVVGGSAPIASVSTPAKDDVKAFNLEKFYGEDWASWSFRMELLFNHYGLLEVMDGELKRPASEGATKEWDRRYKNGFFLLSQCLSSNQLHHVKHLIKDIQCGPKAWKILKDVHAPSSEAMVVVLERQLHAVKINEGDAVQGAFDQLRDLYVKLSAAGVDYPKMIKCYKALSLLPESWVPLVVNLNGMKDSWSLEWIRAQVLQEEFRRKELTAAAGEGGGSVYGMKGFKGRGSKKGKAKEGSGGEQYSGGKRSNKGGKRCGGKCWYFHVESHPRFKCRKLPDGWRPGQPSIEGSKGVHGAMGEGMCSEEGDGGAGGHGGMFYHVGEACSEDMVVPASKVALHRCSHWVIDTGAFMTMTNREDLLDEVRPSKAATVVSATGQVVPVRGEGRAMFMGADGRLVGLKRVLLVPGLCANLLSTKALSEVGMKMEMMGTKVFKATLDGRVLWDLRGGKDMHRSMWEIPVLPWKEAAARLAAEAVRGGHASHVTSGGGGDGNDGGLLVPWGGALPSVTPSTGETDWLTAHRRFGHVALPQLHQLFKEERVKGLRIKGEPKEVGSCETCLTSNFSRFPFHSAMGQSSDPVELVHVDLVGPMKVKGDGGALYSMTMVDDYTRLTWSFPLAKKSDAARVIIEEWLPMVERESGKRVKAIRSNRGGEFLGAEFRSWLKRHGIKQQLTMAYTPQSNGVAERANRIIIEGGRTILVDSGLPLRFWPLAIRHATVIKNRVLTHVGGQHWVPMEKWSGKKPLVDMLRVFGCMGLVHVPEEKHDKLQAAAMWAVHLGLARGSKGWLMWDPKSNTVFTTRDAKFMEGLMFKEWSERGRSKVTIPLGIEVGRNDPLLIPIEFSSSSELSEVSHDLGGAEGEAADVEEVLLLHALHALHALRPKSLPAPPSTPPCGRCGLPSSLPPLPPSLAPPCTPCVQAKISQSPHPSAPSTTPKLLELIHMDLWGPSPTASRQGHCSFLILVDDHSSFATIYPLRAKSDPPSLIIRWAEQGRLHFGRPVAHGPPRFIGSDFSLWRFQFTLWLGIKDLEGVLEGSERRPGADEAEASAGVSSQEGAGAGGASSSSISEGSGGGSPAPRTGRHRLCAEELLKAQEAWDRKDKQRDAGRGVEGGMGAGDRAASKKYQQWQGGGGKKKELDKCLIPGCNRKHSWKECWSRPDGWKPQGYPGEAPPVTRPEWVERRMKNGAWNKKGSKEKAAAAAANEDKKGKEDSSDDAFSFLSLEKETALAGRVLADPNQLILDSGATCGMVPRRDLFTTYHSLPPNSRNVIVGSGDTLRAIGIGTITVKGKEGEVLNLKGVLHVPGLAANLLSCSQLARQEFICTFTMGGCTVRKGGAVVMEAKLEKGLYLVPVCVPHVEKAHGVEAKDAACSTRWRDVEQVTADLLHLRMGHAGRQQLVECVKKGELKGVEIKEGGGQPSKCPDCTTGKLPRTSFPTSTTRASAPLELVHMDVCGPMQTPEREKGSKYFITFLDDFSRLSWVTLVKTKDEVAKVFKRWIRYAEREAGAKVKILRSDRGGEYMGKDLESFLEDKGITHQLSVAYTPQQNGAAERLNWTLIDLARAMLAHAQLDHTWWGAAVQYANWVKNRMGSKGLEGKPHIR